jgi:hypothetical protein
MRSSAVVAWVLTVDSHHGLSKANPLAQLIGAATRARRVSFAALGCMLDGGTLCKHRIKRARRLCAYRRV